MGPVCRFKVGPSFGCVSLVVVSVVREFGGVMWYLMLVFDLASVEVRLADQILSIFISLVDAYDARNRGHLQMSNFLCHFLKL